MSDETVYSIWDEKYPGMATHFTLERAFDHWGDAHRVYDYAASIGETYMYARDNMGIGLRRL